jgi:hypothetical protein
MANEERVYSYRGGIGPLKLLAVLMILLAPMSAYIATQPETGVTTFMSIPMTPGQVAFLGWAISALLVIGGVLMFRGIGQDANKMQRITLTADSITFPDFSGGMATARVLYTRISNIAVNEKKGRKYLDITVPTGKIQLRAANMESPQAFDEMCAELRERIGSTGTLVQAP